MLSRKISGVNPLSKQQNILIEYTNFANNKRHRKHYSQLLQHLCKTYKLHLPLKFRLDEEID